jgi:hypothetical protein
VPETAAGLPLGPPRDTCPHGRPTRCLSRYDRDDDPHVSQPLCPDCYDHNGQVLFNALTTELWRRTTVYLTRALAAQVGMPYQRMLQTVRVRYLKVAEYQARGVVHFHAIVRIDATRRRSARRPCRGGVTPPSPAERVPLVRRLVSVGSCSRPVRLKGSSIVHDVMGREHQSSPRLRWPGPPPRPRARSWSRSPRLPARSTATPSAGAGKSTCTRSPTPPTANAVVKFLVTTTVLRELLQDCQGPAASDELNEVM